MNWFSLTILSEVCLVFYYFFSKRLLNKPDIDPRFYAVCLQFVTGIIAIPFAIASGFEFRLTPESVFLLICTSIVYTIGPSLYYIGLKHVDLSETTVLDSSGVIWSVLLGVLFLNEELTLVKLAGTALILIAVILISFEPKSISLQFKKHELYILIAPFFYVVGAAIDSRLIGFSTPVSYVAVSFTSAGIMMLLANLHRVQKIGRQTLRQSSFKKIVLFNAIFVFATYYFVMKAYSLGGEVSRMYPIQQIESVIIPLLGILFLKERNKIPQKIIAAGIAFGGVLLLR